MAYLLLKKTAWDSSRALICRVLSMKKILVVVLAATVSFAQIPAAFAGSDTAVLNVRASVIGSGRIQNVADITHTDYDPTNAATPNDATGAVTVSATKGMTYKIHISNDRAMTNGTETLNYEIYADPARTTVWGDTYALAESYTSTTNAPSAKTIYSRIPVLQNVPGGVYNDTVTITLEW